MDKKYYIWKLTRAGYNKYHKEYSLGSIDAESRYYSSLRKMRKIVKDMIRSGEISSHNNWTQENWDSIKSCCVVINSGGCPIFSFTKIIVN